MSNGIADLRGYQEGHLVEDDPGWWKRYLEWRRQGQRELTQPRPTVGYGPMVPGLPRPNLAYRQVTADVLGKQLRERLGMEGLGNLIGSRDITASDLSPAEYEALQDAAIRGMGGQLADQGGLLEYSSYDTSEDSQADVGGTHVRLPGGLSQAWDMVKKMMDPSYSMKLTFGQARIVRGDKKRGEDPNDYYVSDRYNYNPPWGEQAREEPTEFGDFLDDMKNRVSGSGFYGYPRAVAQAYGSVPGEGSIARVNIGNLEEALARSRGESQEEDESIFARFINQIRGLRGGDDDVSPSMVSAPSPEDEELRDLRRRLRGMPESDIDYSVLLPK